MNKINSRLIIAMVAANMFAHPKGLRDGRGKLVMPWRGMFANASGPIYSPKRKKFKGWQRQARTK